MRASRRVAQAAATAAMGVAAVSFSTAALASHGASGTEAKSRTSVDVASAIAAARDGKVVVAGSSEGVRRDFALARYTRSGRLDATFGADGLVLTDIGSRRSPPAHSVAIGRDGKIVGARGETIVRYTAAGRLDRTFGRNGKVRTHFGQAYAVAIQADGKVVTAGSGVHRGRTLFALARYTRRGRPDSSFARSGKVVTDFGARSNGTAYEVAIQPDGKIVVAGTAIKDRSSGRAKYGFALARYNADGTLDSSFGSRGRVETKVGDWDTEARGLVVQPDGKLVVVGNALVGGDSGFALVRYTADGDVDPTFGRDGQAFDSAGYVSALALQRDGKLVTAGVGMGRHPNFSIARFLDDGTRDLTFGRNRKRLTDFGATARAYAVAVRPDGEIVAAGTFKGHDFALACYTRTGELDGRFGRGGKVTTDFGSAWASRRGRAG
jgi:uncharacterized delta-60 repeat protein